MHLLMLHGLRDAALVAWWGSDVWCIVDVYFLFLGVFCMCYAYAMLAVTNRVSVSGTEHSWCLYTMCASTVLTVLGEDLVVFYLAFEVMLLVMYSAIATH